MTEHCAGCRCSDRPAPENDEEWERLMARRAETDREIEAMFAEAERLLAEDSYAV